MKPTAYAFLLLTAALLLSSCGKSNDPAKAESQTAPATVPTTDGGTDTLPASETDASLETFPESIADTASDTAVETGSPEIEVLPTVYPTPLSSTRADASAVSAACVFPDAQAAVFADLFADWGWTVAEDGLPVTVTYRELASEFEGYPTDEAYILTVSADGIHIAAESERGAYYAFLTLGQLSTDGSIPAVTVKDAPRVPRRGVIEGFYGAAWTHEFRMELFAFMGQNKMNMYIYAPKDDPKHRAEWRQPYTGGELRRMQELIDSARAHHVDFVYAISPGLDIDLGSGYEADLSALMKKCEAMYDLGVRDFAIFLDDITTLNAEGHAKLLNDFEAKFVKTHEGVSDLLAITVEYTDSMLTTYTDTLAPLVNGNIDLMWTGPGVVTPSITNQSLAAINRKLDREVFIWWNYPVNDVLVNNLYMGACEGLETTLHTSISGLVANPMNQGNASMVPLFTTADYLWNPDAYDVKASLTAAVGTVAPDCAEALELFVSMTCASPMNHNTDSTEMAALLDAYKKDTDPATVDALLAYFERMISAADALEAGENQALYAEIREWVAKFRAYGEMGKAFFGMEKAALEGKGSETLLSLLHTYKTVEATISANPRLVSTYVLTPFFQTTANRMDELFGLTDAITSAPAKPITDCAHYEDFIPAYMTDGDDSTYFWTAGTLAQASGGGTGYFGVDLGEVMDVGNLYIATGVGGSDALASAAIEYSTDNKTWTTLQAGTFTPDVYLSDLTIRARYIRMRGTDPANISWTKVRTFEVNTTRRPIVSTGINATASSSLPVYAGNGYGLMTDGNEATYFWSAREGRAGDTIQLDLGSVTAVTRITFKSGVPAHTADYIENGELSYSINGQTWTTIGKLTGRDTVADVDIQARYIRVTVKADQISWITVSEFSAIGDGAVSDQLSVTGNTLSRADLTVLEDGHVSSLYAPAEAEGQTLRVNFGDSTSLRLLATSLPESGLVATLTDADGKELHKITLTLDTVVEAPAGSVLLVPLGGGLTLSEILWS